MKQLILIVLGAVCASSLYAQSITFGGVWDEELLKHRVKQINEFMNRFNYERDIDDRPIADRNDIEERKKYIFALFDVDMVKSASNKDSVFTEIEAFADAVVNVQNPVYLAFTDHDWTAEAVCSAKFKGKSVKVSIFLKTEEIANNEYKWVISDAQSPFLDITPKLKTTRYMISPVDNELEFMNLPDISDVYKKDVIHYSGKSFRFDRVSVLFSLIYNDLLKIEAVERVVYHFYRAPGYEFSVENIDRASKNAGWLITRLYKTTRRADNE